MTLPDGMTPSEAATLASEHDRRAAVRLSHARPVFPHDRRRPAGTNLGVGGAR